MDLRGIERTVARAEKLEDEILGASFDYSQTVDGYLHSEMYNEIPDGLDEFSRNELVDETARFARTINRYEGLLYSLEDAREKLQDFNEHRIDTNHFLTVDSIERRLERVYEIYRENLEHAFETAGRASDPEVPDPLLIRSAFFREESLDENLEMVELLE